MRMDITLFLVIQYSLTYEDAFGTTLSDTEPVPTYRLLRPPFLICLNQANLLDWSKSYHNNTQRKLTALYNVDNTANEKVTRLNMK